MAYNPLEHKLPGEFEYQGKVYAYFNQGITIDRFQRLQTDPSDVLIASYPKSGSTWMSGILPLVLEMGDASKVRAKGNFRQRIIRLDFNIPEVPSISEISSIKPPRVMKTHFQYQFMKPLVEDNELKTIILLRNPKDILVSYFHFYCTSEGMNKFKGDFHDFFELFKAERLLYGDMFDWCKGWWEKKALDNLIFVKYEDMVKDFPSVIRRIAEFCNMDLDEEIVKKIVHQCSIDNMRNDPMYSFEFDGFNTADMNRYRKGIVGDWKNYFSKEESEIVDGLCRTHFDPAGLTFQETTFVCYIII